MKHCVQRSSISNLVISLFLITIDPALAGSLGEHTDAAVDADAVVGDAVHPSSVVAAGSDPLAAAMAERPGKIRPEVAKIIMGKKKKESVRMKRELVFLLFQ